MQIALKIDVDTYRGLAEGVPRLAQCLSERKIPASFFVTLGPDTSGRAALRVFKHRGFLKKMRRTSALSVYGLRTVLSGTLLPARPMGTSFAEPLRRLRDQGFEVSPHGFDHILWHDEAAAWDEARAKEELDRARDIYRFIFSRDPESFAAPGWQAGQGTWRAMDSLGLLYHSDSRGDRPYFPVVAGQTLKTLEIPTTLPTWDEMLAWDNITTGNLVEETWKRLDAHKLNVWTIHAEFEGGVSYVSFCNFIQRAAQEKVQWMFLPEVARAILQGREGVPSREFSQDELPGRAGRVTCQR